MWGGGSHIGIYIGNGKAISTLRSGVRVHGVFAVTARFTAYLHTGMSTKPPCVEVTRVLQPCRDAPFSAP